MGKRLREARVIVESLTCPLNSPSSLARGDLPVLGDCLGALGSHPTSQAAAHYSSNKNILSSVYFAPLLRNLPHNAISHAIVAIPMTRF